MDINSVYTINDPDVIADSIKGETLIINLINGLYYSTDGTGDEIWRRLQRQSTVGEIIEALTDRYRGDASTIREQVLRFISELTEDRLIVECPPGRTQTFAAPDVPADVKPFSPPVLQRYTDYQDLLLLDPIHEVVESAGWPVAKPQAGA